MSHLWLSLTLDCDHITLMGSVLAMFPAVAWVSLLGLHSLSYFLAWFLLFMSWKTLNITQLAFHDVAKVSCVRVVCCTNPDSILQHCYEALHESTSVTCMSDRIRFACCMHD